MQNCESNLQKWDPQMWLLKMKIEFMFAKTPDFCGKVIYITQNNCGVLKTRLLVFISAEFHFFNFLFSCSFILFIFFYK